MKMKKNMIKYIFSVVIALVCVIKANRILGVYGMSAGVTEYILMLFAGCTKEYRHVPVFLIIFVCCVALISASERKKRTGADIKLIMKTGRKKWWYVRSLQCILDVTVYFVVLLIVFGVCAHGKIGGGDETGQVIADYYVNDVEYSYMGNTKFITVGIVIPLMMTSVIAIATKLISVMFDSVTAVVITCILTVASVWNVVPLLPQNSLMILRNSFYMTDMGTNEGVMLVYAVFLVAFFMICGGCLVNRCDIK